jgi:hypothetical protein
MIEYTSIRVAKSTIKELKDIKKDNSLGCSHEFLILKMADSFKKSLKV